jgi:ferrochelatase
MCSLPLGETEEFALSPDRSNEPARQRAVLLINLGTPDEPDVSSVRRYLAEILSDPEVIRLPRGLSWLNGLLGRALSRLRAPRSAEKYRKIWTEQGSPLRTITQQQVSALARVLPDGMRVFCAMRYGRPGIGEMLKQVEALGIEELVINPMYPQYSGTSTFTAVQELYRQVRRAGCRVDLTIRSIWYDDTGYINAQARLIHEYAQAHGLTPKNTHLVYSLHSLPVSYVDRGDPYVGQIRKTAELATLRLGWPSDRATMGYQSRLGSVKWLQPTTTDVLTELSQAGEKQVLVCPLSFTTDCLETLEEIQIRYREHFEHGGGRLLVCPALNASEPFIGALKNLVKHGRRPMTLAEAAADPLMAVKADETPAAEADAEIDSFFMMGLSLGGRLGTGQGPAVASADAETFRAVKRSQCEIPDVLRAICEDGRVREALLWNTCRRFELYGWVKDGADPAEVAAQAGHHLFNGTSDTPEVNVLHGADAWHHLMRTSAGLNSGLPGEREVLQQFQGAHRLAERAGTTGPLADRLLKELLKCERELRGQTNWGQFEPDYCHASISRVVQSTGLDLADSRCVVIGGSTTSCAVIEVLADRFDVRRRDLTLLHRGHGHGGHLKMLRRAIGNGRRVRVHSYSEKSVIQAIAEADVVFFGLDHKEPVLDWEQIRHCRDYSARPLTIVDFNMFGSTAGIEDLDGVRLWKADDLERAVAAFADDMCGSEQFVRATTEAELWILDHLPVCAGVSGGIGDDQAR